MTKAIKITKKGNPSGKAIVITKKKPQPRKTRGSRYV